ncbi:Acyltransferase [Pirellulimonas nuda]|uniref:Acyltransferase n=1 Tax=Pirellulimonas nuda TaxID=2528009 RepID=A0A518DGL2_9BACT|nr:lysophospholipid acyltransferase family protein [Pirellulimonas nuda]QDU90617.1 Acyltransferase [Pirellulimonas nuda]
MNPQAPQSSAQLVGWFRWYVRRFARKHLHSVCLASDGIPSDPAGPLIVYGNHAGWWDPLVALLIAHRVFPNRAIYAPFDAEALRRYPFFERLGFFGVEQDSPRGAAAFLKTSQGVLARPGASLWITPEGRFTDPRDHDAPLRPGLAHLAASLPNATLLPLATEYPFWEEKLPEALSRFGTPLLAAEYAGLSKEAWSGLLHGRLRETQRLLAEQSLARDGAAFEVLVGGSAGVGGVYEWVRRTAAAASGRSYRASHGAKLSR